MSSAEGLGSKRPQLLPPSTAIGIDSMGTFWNYFIVGFIYKTTVEFVVMPITMTVIAWLKRREPTYWEAEAPAA